MFHFASVNIYIGKFEIRVGLRFGFPTPDVEVAPSQGNFSPHHFASPDQLPCGEDGCLGHVEAPPHLHVFQGGIQPLWEDPSRAETDQLNR